MTNRNKLHGILEELIGNKNVYFQPPESLKMKYPCIRYQLTGIPVEHADDTTYILHHKYEVILITTDPDNEIKENICTKFNTRMTNIYANDGLYHYVYEIHY